MLEKVLGRLGLMRVSDHQKWVERMKDWCEDFEEYHRQEVRHVADQAAEARAALYDKKSLHELQRIMLRVDRFAPPKPVVLDRRQDKSA